MTKHKPPAELLARTLTVSEVASLFGRSARWVQGLAQQGVFAKPAAGAYRLGDVCAGVVAHFEGRLAAGSKVAASKRAADARTREIELRIAERQRDLIPAEEARSVVITMAGLMKAELIGLPARLTRDPAEKRRLEDEVNAMLHRLADALDYADTIDTEA